MFLHEELFSILGERNDKLLLPPTLLFRVISSKKAKGVFEDDLMLLFFFLYHLDASFMSNPVLGEFLSLSPSRPPGNSGKGGHFPN